VVDNSAERRIPPEVAAMGFEEHLPGGFLLTTVEKVVG
jgi:hypothetical protein